MTFSVKCVLVAVSFCFSFALLSSCSGPRGPQGIAGPVTHDTVYQAQSSWASIIDSVGQCSYMIGYRNEGTGELILLGSGVAINSNTILTNAHVFDGEINSYILYKQSGYNITPVAVKNGSAAYGSGVFTLDRGGMHENYSDTTVFTYDLGFFTTSTTLPQHISIPPSDTIRKLKVGQYIGTIGYPGETASKITHVVTATFKDGIISALLPFSTSAVPTVANSYVVQHNFNTTGGTSGSPILNQNGKLIALNNSGVVQYVWNDATGDFAIIPTGSIGYGIRADLVNDMFSQGLYAPDTISSYYIPNQYIYYPGSRISLKSGSKSVYLGTTIAAAKASAKPLFNTNVGKDSAAMGDYTDGSFYVTDSCSYFTMFLKESATIDNVWSIAITGTNTEYSSYYLPSIRDYWGITVGASRTYIINTYGTGYNNVFSVDSSVYYYNYSSLGVGFGFVRNDGDWLCDYIQIAQVGRLQKTASGVGVSQFRFPNPNAIKFPLKTALIDRKHSHVQKIFR